MGHEHQRAGSRGRRERHHVLRGAAAKGAAGQRGHPAGVDHQQDEGGRGDAGAHHRLGHGDNAGRDPGQGEQGVGAEPSRPGAERLDLGGPAEFPQAAGHPARGPALGVRSGCAALEGHERLDLLHRVHTRSRSGGLGGGHQLTRSMAVSPGLECTPRDRATPRPWRAGGRCRRRPPPGGHLPAVVRGGHRAAPTASLGGHHHPRRGRERLAGVRRARRAPADHRPGRDRAPGAAGGRRGLHTRAGGPRDRGRRGGMCRARGLPAARPSRPPGRGGRRFGGRAPDRSLLRPAGHGGDQLGGVPRAGARGRGGRAGARARTDARTRSRSPSPSPSPNRSRPRGLRPPRRGPLARATGSPSPGRGRGRPDRRYDRPGWPPSRT